ncbi:hypothetical protein [Streptomyces sp. NPDC003327]
MVHVPSQTKPLTFDTFGFERLDENRLFDPRTRDVVVLGVHPPLPPGAPLWLDGLDTLRRELARTHAADGCLVEADAVTLDGVPALYTLVTERQPDPSTGWNFRASFVLAKADRTAVLTGQFEEWDISGLRESLVLLKLGVPYDIPGRAHPYDPALPYQPSYDAAWDEQFPEHPLTKARAWARRVRETAVVERDFAALPGYRAG